MLKDKILNKYHKWDDVPRKFNIGPFSILSSTVIKRLEQGFSIEQAIESKELTDKVLKFWRIRGLV